MSAAAARVVVVIPTRNAGARFERTLEAIAGQHLGEPFEILVIDSGSRDGTPERCRALGAEVVNIPPAEFSHGGTRNRAISRCSHQYVVLTVQDAIPADGSWLSALVAALDENPRAAGAYSRHIPRDDAGFIARYVAAYWHRHRGGRVEQRIADPAAFEELPFRARQWRCTFNNVSSVIRRSVWERHHFREIPFAEDLAWGYDVLRAGHTIIYEPRSVVRHSHQRPLWYEFRRAYLDAKTVGEILGERAWPLSGKELARLGCLWRRINAETRPSRLRGEVERIQNEDGVALDESEWYGRRFDLPALARVIGPASPYPQGEREDLIWALDQQHRWARGEEAPEAVLGSNHLPATEGSGGSLPRGRLWRLATTPLRVARRVSSLPTGTDSVSLLDWWRHLRGRPPRSLAERLRRAASGGWSRRLAERDRRLVFQSLWEDLGRDYVRRAVLEEIPGAQERSIAALELRVEQYAAELARAALREGVLTPELYGQIRLYATAVNVGRRLGAAHRYGPDARWQHCLARWLERGI